MFFACVYQICLSNMQMTHLFFETNSPSKNKYVQNVYFGRFTCVLWMYFCRYNQLSIVQNFLVSPVNHILMNQRNTITTVARLLHLLQVYALDSSQFISKLIIFINRKRLKLKIIKVVEYLTNKTKFLIYSFTTYFCIGGYFAFSILMSIYLNKKYKTERVKNFPSFFQFFKSKIRKIALSSIQTA